MLQHHRRASTVMFRKMLTWTADCILNFLLSALAAESSSFFLQFMSCYFLFLCISCHSQSRESSTVSSRDALKISISPQENLEGDETIARDYVNCNQFYCAALKDYFLLRRASEVSISSTNNWKFNSINFRQYSESGGKRSTCAGSQCLRVAQLLLKCSTAALALLSSSVTRVKSDPFSPRAEAYWLK